MKFLKNYLIILILSCIFVFCGGYLLFTNIWPATAACAFVIAVIASIFASQEEKIEKLEERIKKLEEKSNS